MHDKSIKQLIDEGALFVCNHSGGKDSQAMYLKLLEIVPADQILVVHADLGRVEWDDLQSHIKGTILEEHELHVCQAIYKDGSTKDLISYTKDRGKWPSPGQRWCTSDLKRGPIEKVTRAYMKEHGYTQVVNCMGIRAQESPGRAKQVAFRPNNRLTLNSGARVAWDWLPIFEMLEDEVFETIAAAGQKPHYVYELGMSRLSCCFCIMASKKDLTIAATLRPNLYREYVELERDLGFTLQAGKTLEETTGITLG
jgi:3'-phosphoadenosine 5'-phosphosulfate sulfotransferase (PAPS reductase)/FAD synthetase